MDFFLAASRACAGWQQLQVECACKGDGIRHDSLLVLKLFASRSWSGLWSPRSLAGLITSNRKEAGEEAQWSNWSNGRSSPEVQQYISEDWSNGRKLVKRKEKPSGSSDNYTPHRQTFVMFGTWARNCTTRYPLFASSSASRRGPQAGVSSRHTLRWCWVYSVQAGARAPKQ